jgi:hypothetical protein
VQIFDDYKNHADFLTVYVREAHPTDEWQMKSNVKDDVCYAQPRNLSDRLAIANDFIKRYKYPVPFGVDDMTNAANDAYAAWPERLYIIDERKIATVAERPVQIHPSEVATAGCSCGRNILINRPTQHQTKNGRNKTRREKADIKDLRVFTDRADFFGRHLPALQYRINLSASRFFSV